LAEPQHIEGHFDGLDIVVLLSVAVSVIFYAISL
jgi:hypothetical protein